MAPLASGLPDEIADSEQLGRFLVSSGHFARTTGRVKHVAFLPDKKDDETSVFRVDGLDDRAISEIGARNVPQGHFHGAAIVRADVVRREKLTATAAEPPDRHGILRSWPLESDPEFEKSRRMEIAQGIAEEAVFLPRVPPV